MSRKFKTKPRGMKAAEAMFVEEGATFRLLRTACHAVYEIDTPLGPRKLAIALTPGEYRGAKNKRSEIRRLLKGRP